eukprot:jgi/Tetstr1/459425/TSEL_000438.t1
MWPKKNHAPASRDDEPSLLTSLVGWGTSSADSWLRRDSDQHPPARQGGSPTQPSPGLPFPNMSSVRCQPSRTVAAAQPAPSSRGVRAVRAWSPSASPASSSGLRRTSQAWRSAPRVVCKAEERGGGNNLNVKGKPPTSPGAWEEMQKVLSESNVGCIAPQELKMYQERGYTVVDIRPSGDYDEWHIPNSVNIPFYRPIEGWSSKQVMRRAAYALFGVFNGTEYNPTFIPEVEAVAGKSDGVVLVCSLGGQLEEDSERTGTSKSQTRSLMAAYELVSAGFSKVSTLRGGFGKWIDAGRDVSSNKYEDW